jgi:flavin reductase (DIM6/NTAB) family NADH-FMN oxidoreductase RutF
MDDEDVAVFRQAMGHLAAGVVVVTTYISGRPWGMTVSACCSISLSPPTLLVSLMSETVAARQIVESGSFGVSILGEGAEELARFGSKPGFPKFLDEKQCDLFPESLSPAVAGALAHIDCVLTNSISVADHRLFIGEMRVGRNISGEPLVYFGRSFRRLASTVPADLLYTNW